MKVFTASWSEYTGPGRIGICQGMPRGVTAGYRMFKPLAPSWDLIKTARDVHDYRRRYFAEVLAGLDPRVVLDQMQRLAGDHPPVMMCYEKTPLTDTNFCHRTMAGEWLADKLGIEVREWSGLKELPLLELAGRQS